MPKIIGLMYKESINVPRFSGECVEVAEQNRSLYSLSSAFFFLNGIVLMVLEWW